VYSNRHTVFEKSIVPTLKIFSYRRTERYIILLIFAILISTKLCGQIPLVIDKKPNSEINKYFNRKSLNYIKLCYDSFISRQMNDSVLKFLSNLNEENTDFNQFKIYILPLAYFNLNDLKWPSSNDEISKYLLIDTNVYFSAVFFQKGNKTSITCQNINNKYPNFGFVSEIYFINQSINLSKEEKEADVFFYNKFLKAHPDNIFIINGYPEYICFQRNKKYYYFDMYSNQIKPLIDLNNKY
jgi:hypothetical protein